MSRNRLQRVIPGPDLCARGANCKCEAVLRVRHSATRSTLLAVSRFWPKSTLVWPQSSPTLGLSRSPEDLGQTSDLDIWTLQTSSESVLTQTGPHSADLVSDGQVTRRVWTSLGQTGWSLRVWTQGLFGPESRPL